LDPVAPAGIGEDRAPVVEVAGPGGAAVGVEGLEELVGGAVADPTLRDAGEDQAGGGLGGGGGGVGGKGDGGAAGRGGVPGQVEEARAVEARGELPVGPGPGAGVVARPGELRIAGVPRPHVENAVDHEQAARLAAGLAVALGLLAAGRAEVDAGEAVR